MQFINRSRRRMERKRVFDLPLLVLAIALVSFAVGVMVGQRGRDRTAPLPAAVAVPPPTAKPAITPPTTKELTFYDTLPKGEQAPLGSGINLPREASPPPEPRPASPAPALPAPSPPVTVSPNPVDSPVGNWPETGTTAPARGKGSWVIQAASYKAAEDAQRMRERLVGKGFRATIREADLGEKGKWYRVVVGPYPSDGEASQVAGRLQNEGISGLVRKD